MVVVASVTFFHSFRGSIAPLSRLSSPLCGRRIDLSRRFIPFSRQTGLFSN